MESFWAPVIECDDCIQLQFRGVRTQMMRTETGWDWDWDHLFSLAN